MHSSSAFTLQRPHPPPHPPALADLKQPAVADREPPTLASVRSNINQKEKKAKKPRVDPADVAASVARLVKSQDELDFTVQDAVALRCEITRRRNALAKPLAEIADLDKKLLRTTYILEEYMKVTGVNRLKCDDGEISLDKKMTRGHLDKDDKRERMLALFREARVPDAAGLVGRFLSIRGDQAEKCIVRVVAGGANSGFPPGTPNPRTPGTARAK